MTIAHSSTTTLADDTASDSSISVVVSGTNPALLLKLAFKGTGLTNGVPVFNSSEAFTLVAVDVNGDARSYLYILVNPTATTANVVIAKTAKARAVHAVSLYTGSANPIRVRSGTAATGNGTNNTPTVDITGTSGDLIVDSMCQVSGGPDTIDAQTGTARHDIPSIGGGTDTRGGSQELAATGGADTMSYTMSSTDNWAIVGASLEEAAASSATPHGPFGLALHGPLGGPI